MLWQDVELLDVRGILPHRHNYHTHGEAVLRTAHPHLHHADEADQVVKRERYVEGFIDEPEARE
jgi:hypothetical protein